MINFTPQTPYIWWMCVGCVYWRECVYECVCVCVYMKPETVQSSSSQLDCGVRLEMQWLLVPASLSPGCVTLRRSLTSQQTLSLCGILREFHGLVGIKWGLKQEVLAQCLVHSFIFQWLPLWYSSNFSVINFPKNIGSNSVQTAFSYMCVWK